MDFNIDSYLPSFQWKNFHNKCRHLPSIGTICYGSYNLHLSLNAGLQSLFPMLIGNRSLNVILFTSHFGIGYYINGHLKHIGKQHEDGDDNRFILSGYASLMFNFGSFLFTAFIMKNYFPQKSQLFRGIFSLFISMMNIYMGKKLLKLSTTR